MFIFYTGTSANMFNIVIQLCNSVSFDYIYGEKVNCLSINDQILMTFMKLRLNLPYVDLEFRFNTSKSTVSNVVLTFIVLLHQILYKNLMNEIPTQYKNRLCLPHRFENFQNCRMIIACTEVSCDILSKLYQQKITYSSYKHRNTLKGLIGIAPNRVVTFASKLYPGSTLDKKLFHTVVF